MARTVYAKRYAQAVFQIALEKEELDKWQADLVKVAGLGGDVAFVAALENPKLRFDDKISLVSAQLGDVNELAKNLVYLLVARGRLSKIGEIADEYQRLLNSHRGIETAEVAATIAFDDEDKLRLEERLGNIVGKKIIVRSEVDSSLIGGIIARIGGKLLDGSTRSRLEILKRELGGVGR